MRRQQTQVDILLNAKIVSSLGSDSETTVLSWLTMTGRLGISTGAWPNGQKLIRFAASRRMPVRSDKETLSNGELKGRREEPGVAARENYLGPTISPRDRARNCSTAQPPARLTMPGLKHSADAVINLPTNDPRRRPSTKTNARAKPNSEGA